MSEETYLALGGECFAPPPRKPTQGEKRKLEKETTDAAIWKSMDEAMDAALEKDVPSGPPQKKPGYVPVFDHVTGKELPVLDYQCKAAVTVYSETQDLYVRD